MGPVCKSKRNGVAVRNSTYQKFWSIPTEIPYTPFIAGREHVARGHFDLRGMCRQLLLVCLSGSSMPYRWRLKSLKGKKVWDLYDCVVAKPSSPVHYPASHFRLSPRRTGAISSGGEHYLDTVGVIGSNPISRTIELSSAGTSIGFLPICRVGMCSMARLQ